MTRDLSLKCIKIHGHYVRCQICKRHNAVERFYGVLVCRQCLKPMAIGFMTGKLVAQEAKERWSSD